MENIKEQLEEVIKKHLPEKKEPTEHQISCPDHMPGCCVYHCEYRLSNEDKSFNQALSQINTSFIADEVLKVVVEKIEKRVSFYKDEINKNLSNKRELEDRLDEVEDIINLLSEHLSTNKENKNNGKENI